MMKKRLFSVFLLSVFMGVALQAGNYRKEDGVPPETACPFL